MSLFEIIGESVDPGTTGSLETGKPPHEPRSRLAVIVRGIVALGVVGTVFVMTALVDPLTPGRVTIVACVMAAYLLLAYFVRPQPDYDNLGWAGGIFDNPLRYSDDINRFLVLVMVVLWPGRFVSTAIVDLFRRPPTSAA